MIEVWQQQDAYARRIAEIQTAKPDSPAEALRRKAVETMRHYWLDRISLLSDGTTIWWKPDYEGFVQRVAMKARELDIPPHVITTDYVNDIASQCCANHCGMPADEPALVPPPDMREAMTERGVPEGCAKP